MIVVRAPFRIPLGGGGTDLPNYYRNHGGQLITAAIDKYMYLSLNASPSVTKIKISYSKTETVESVDQIEHEIVRETLKHLDFNSKIELCSMADAAAGTGLGSSGAYTVALLKGMNALLGRSVSKQELAEEACHIEMVRLNRPSGKQDQYASALGGIFAMDIARDGAVETRQLPIERSTVTELEYRMLMFYTETQRSADLILKEQSSALSSNDSKVVMSMHQIKEIGLQIERALIAGDVDQVGTLMHEHWLTKRRVSSKMSTGAIDEWYETALKSGALGGKIMGAGGGGFLLLVARSDQRNHLIRTMTAAGLRYVDYTFDYEGAQVMLHV